MHANISGTQSAAARAMLSLNLQTVQSKTNIKINSISRFEKGKGHLNEINTINLQKYYEKQGLEFIEFDGVRRKPSGSFKTLCGFDGFKEFTEDVYNTISEHPSKSIMVSNVNERLFSKWMGVYVDDYLNKMLELQKSCNFTFQIIIEELDSYFLASSYAEYKALPKDHFGNVTFYVYGNKLATIIFSKENVEVHIIENENIADSYRKHFSAIWSMASPPRCN